MCKTDLQYAMDIICHYLIIKLLSNKSANKYFFYIHIHRSFRLKIGKHRRGNTRFLYISINIFLVYLFIIIITRGFAPAAFGRQPIWRLDYQFVQLSRIKNITNASRQAASNVFIIFNFFYLQILIILTM